jgi:hypothetical protein
MGHILRDSIEGLKGNVATMLDETERQSGGIRNTFVLFK